MTPKSTPRLAGLSFTACLLVAAVAGCPSEPPTSSGLKPVGTGRKLTQASSKPSGQPSGAAPSGSPSAIATLPPQGGGSPSAAPATTTPTANPSGTPTTGPTASATASATTSPAPTASATRTPRPSRSPSASSTPSQQGLLVVDTLAGSSQGFADGTAAAARFNTPRGLVLDGNGNLYVADSANHRIRKVTPQGEVSTIAGSVAGFADDDGTQGLLDTPQGLALSADGKALWVADTGNHAIRKIDLENPNHPVTTVAGGVQGYAEGDGEDARFDGPQGLVADSSGTLWVADTGNHALRQVTAAGEVSTVAGGVAGLIDTTYPGVRFQGLTDLAVTGTNGPLIADAANHAIRRVNLAGALVETLAGDGSTGTLDASGDNARFANPCGVAFGPNGNLYVADRNNHRLRMVTAAGVVTTLTGDQPGAIEGPMTSARFQDPSDVAVTPNGVIYVADTGNHRIRVIKAP